ncbi:LAFA_0F02058g1_1 [Lachancea sp. 'fantastica']|nr:LAFA_0F02058g1_1 [Lachancea sp. 'fantastica']
MSAQETGDVSTHNNNNNENIEEERAQSAGSKKESVLSHFTNSLGEVEKELVPDVVLPSNFSKCPRSDLVILISRMLSFLIHINDSASKTEQYELTRFHSRVPPQISVYDYLMRMTRYSVLEPAVLIASVYYIDLFSAVYPAFSLNSLTVHRFLLTATAVASKGLCDSFCTNTHYARVGGVQCSELHVLENDFLKRVNYRILPRDDNIMNCKIERQEDVFVTASYVEGNVRGPNNGFNVLDTYYRKIIEIVGSYDSSPDKTKKAHYSMETPPSKRDAEPSKTQKKKKRVLEESDADLKANGTKKPA